jgi:hypothetical protein
MRCAASCYCCCCCLAGADVHLWKRAVNAFRSFQRPCIISMLQMARTQKNKATSGHLGMLKVG